MRFLYTWILQFIVRNIYKSVFILFLSQSSLISWTFVSDKTTKGFYYVNKVTFRKHLRMGSGCHEPLPCDGRIGTCSPAPSPLGRGDGLRVESVTNGQRFNQSGLIWYKASIKFKRTGFRERPGCWTQRRWESGVLRESTDAPCPFHTPFPLHLHLPASELHPFMVNQGSSK